MALFIALASFAGALRSNAWSRALAAFAILLALGLVVAPQPQLSRLIFAHLHNWVALAAWAMVFRSRLRALWLPAVVIGSASAVLASGALSQYALHGAGVRFLGLHVLDVAAWMAPGLRAERAVGLTASYVFLQSIHYAIWLHLIPQEDTANEGTLSFRMTLRALVADFGKSGFFLVLVAAAGMIVAGCVRPFAARNLYVSLATFHGYLELAMLTYFWVARRTFGPEVARFRPSPSPA